MPQPELRRELQLSHTTAIVIANMIGTGIFTTTGFLAGDLGRPSLVLGIWLVGGAIAIAGCLCYSELGVNLPKSGGEYIFLREAWGPMWGFLSGWISFFAGFAAPIAAAALAFSAYVATFFPSFDVTGAAVFGNWFHLGNGYVLAAGVVLLSSLINSIGVRLAANVQNVITALKLGVLILFLACAFIFGHGSMAHFSQVTARTSPHSLPAQFAVSLVFVMFAYSGWNAATYVSGEMKHPEKTIPASMVIGTLIVGAFYLLLNIAFIYALPLGSMKGVVAIGGAAANALFGSQGGKFFSAIMSVGLLSCVNAMVMAGPRVYFAMAVDGCFFRGAATVHPRRRTPHHAIACQALAAVLMILVSSFDHLVIYIGFALMFFAALAVAGMIRLRRRPDWKKLGVVNWAYPLIPALFIAASTWMLFYTASMRPKESAYGVLTIVLGGIFYFVKFRKSSPQALP